MILSTCPFFVRIDLLASDLALNNVDNFISEDGEMNHNKICHGGCDHMSFVGRYQSGPWANGKIYREKEFADRLNAELSDFVKWCAPSEDEKYVRMWTAFRYTQEIEFAFPGATVCLHGSSATNTYLITSDIDLVVFVDTSNPVQTLIRIKQILDEKELIISGKVIANARVPIIMAIDTITKLPIDISISNAGGVMTAKRMRKYLDTYPHLTGLTYFLKMFVKLNHLDKPFEGGFGSCELMHICIFVIQRHPDKSTLAELVIKLLELIGEELNPFLAGLSITGRPHFISKMDRMVFLDDIPQALVVEDSANPKNIMGIHASKSIEFSDRCKSVLRIMSLSDSSRVSPLSIVFPSVDLFSERRAEMSVIASSIRSGGFKSPTCVRSRSDSELKARRKNDV